MSTRTLTARSLPYVEISYSYAMCKRCGILRKVKRSQYLGYCADCLSDARRLGWIEDAA